MRLLLDSHVALWWLENNDRLGVASRRAISEADLVYYSAVTPWELGIKQALGKLSIPSGLVDVLKQGGFQPLSISPEHAERAPTLPAHHRDPFDRMLIAQAQLESLAIVTADRAFDAYEVQLVNARD